MQGAPNVPPARAAQPAGSGDGLPAGAERPRPVVTALTEPYWRAAQDGRFVLQHCRACGTFTHFPADACAGCGEASQLDWRELSGAGRVYTFSVIHRGVVPGFELPYVIAWIDLSEGPRVFGGVQGCAPEDVFIDMPVRIVFEERAGFGQIPTFAPCDAPTEARL